MPIGIWDFWDEHLPKKQPVCFYPTETQKHLSFWPANMLLIRKTHPWSIMTCSAAVFNRNTVRTTRCSFKQSETLARRLVPQKVALVKGAIQQQDHKTALESGGHNPMPLTAKGPLPSHAHMHVPSRLCPPRAHLLRVDTLVRQLHEMRCEFVLLWFHPKNAGRLRAYRSQRFTHADTLGG